MEKDYSLLRPFDLEAAKRGEKIIETSGEFIYTYLAGPTLIGEYAFLLSNGTIFIADAENVLNICKMAPIAFVEGKPVYKGDVLYTAKKECFTVDGIREFGLLTCEDWCEYTYNLTWQKPKTKREGWVNVYPNERHQTMRYSSKKEAIEGANSTVIATVRIEWEE